MVNVICKVNIDDVLLNPEQYITTENQKLNLVSITNKIKNIFNQEVLNEKIIGLRFSEINNEHYLIMTDNSIYKYYYPSDYNCNLHQLFVKIEDAAVQNLWF